MAALKEIGKLRICFTRLSAFHFTVKMSPQNRLTQSGTAELSALDPSVAPGEQGTGQGWPAGSRRQLRLSGLSLEPTQGLAQSPDTCLVLDKCSLNCHLTPSAPGREWESRSSGTGPPAPT